VSERDDGSANGKQEIRILDSTTPRRKASHRRTGDAGRDRGIELLDIEAQPVMHRRGVGIEDALPVVVAPAGGADVDGHRREQLADRTGFQTDQSLYASPAVIRTAGSERSNHHADPERLRRSPNVIPVPTRMLTA
jgi:hypothetical protein